MLSGDKTQTPSTKHEANSIKKKTIGKIRVYFHVESMDPDIAEI